MTKLKNSFGSFNSRWNQPEESKHELNDRSFEIMQSEEQNENRMKKMEESLQDVWDRIRRNNICIMGIAEVEEKEKGTENLFKIILAENFPNVGREMAIQIHEAKDPK